MGCYEKYRKCMISGISGTHIPFKNLPWDVYIQRVDHGTSSNTNTARKKSSKSPSKEEKRSKSLSKVKKAE